MHRKQKVITRTVAAVLLVGSVWEIWGNWCWFTESLYDSAAFCIFYGLSFAAVCGLLLGRRWAVRLATILLTVYSAGYVCLAVFVIQETRQIHAESSLFLQQMSSPHVRWMLVSVFSLRAMGALVAKMLLRPLLPGKRKMGPADIEQELENIRTTIETKREERELKAIRKHMQTKKHATGA